MRAGGQAGRLAGEKAIRLSGGQAKRLSSLKAIRLANEHNSGFHIQSCYFPEVFLVEGISYRKIVAQSPRSNYRIGKFDVSFFVYLNGISEYVLIWKS
jgi:hypothetical protein